MLMIWTPACDAFVLKGPRDKTSEMQAVFPVPGIPQIYITPELSAPLMTRSSTNFEILAFSASLHGSSRGAAERERALLPFKRV